jgi:hypothetical protein
VRASKTDAGIRQIDLLPALRDELAAHKAKASSISPDDYVFATARGSEPKQSNIRRRVFDKAVSRANEKLIEAGDVPLPEGLTHTSFATPSLRSSSHSASIRVASWINSATPTPDSRCGSTDTECAATPQPRSAYERSWAASIGHQ